MPLLLVDGSSYLFRAYHALPNFTNKKGFPTGAIFGVLNMLRKLKEDFADHSEILIVFDAKGKNFRHALYPEYKANRSAMAEDLAVQIQPLHQLIELLGFPLYQKSGVEADDVIGSLATQYAIQNKEVLIISGDKDLAQLLGPHVRIIDTMKNIEINDAHLLEKFGVCSDKIIDLLSLTGDTSDNVPGIPGVGPKTAAKWLNEYGSLQGIINHLDQIKGKVGENLKAHQNQLSLAKELITIKTDLDLHDLPSFIFGIPKRESLIPLLQEYSLDSWLKILNTHATPIETKTQETHYHLINTDQSLQQFIKRLHQEPYFAFDTETNGLDALQADLVGISFSFKNAEAYFIPIKHDTPVLKNALSLLAPIFADPLIGKIAHNAKFDLKVLHSHGLNVHGILFDTLLAAYLLNSGSKNDLHSLSLRELGLNGMQYEDLVGTGRKQIPIESVPLNTLSHYACEDADFTWQLYEKMRLKLEANPRLNQVFNTLEMPLFEVLANMEEYGVLIDATQLHALSQAWGTRLHQIAEEIFRETALNFNLNSPKQLIHILYEKLNLPATHKTPKGEPSTNEAALQDLAHLHPVPKLLLEHRHLSKLKNTYTDKLPGLIHAKTGRIHTQYQQAVVATGRLSSSDPNLQNIPFKTTEGKKIRAAFIAAPHCVLISADYSQVELRIMAHFSGDIGLIQAFQDGKDIHRATAAEVLSIPESEITSDQRRQAKAVNFGLIYGMSSFGLAQQLQISRKDADTYIKRYFERYPGVLQYMEATRLLAHEKGYVETLMGRRLDLPKINSRNIMEKKGAERAAINAPMQGTAADIIKKAMIDFWQWQNTHPEFHTHLTMQVHDELIVETPEIYAEIVPLLVDIECAHSWA
ncbi:MAG: DNA polymerase I [Gammaproteobacteria bacterium]|nr:DNA polymerase I [Gammaproteobacteria bacterium]